MRRDVSFLSDGEQVSGWLYVPEALTGKAPAIVMANAISAVKEITLPGYAERFCQAGFVVLVFDYRHYGGSAGEPRNHLVPHEQLQDIRNAITWLRAQPEVDKDNIGGWGLSIGGVHLLTPDRADTLALLAQHGTKHGWGRLEDLAVFAALARRDDDAVVTAHARAAAVGGGRAVLLGVELARRVLSVPRPEELDAPTRVDTQVMRLADEVLSRWTRGETEFRPPLRWDLRWTEGAPDRLRLLARATFDPTLQEWEAMRTAVAAQIGMMPLGEIAGVQRPLPWPACTPGIRARTALHYRARLRSL